VTSWATIIQGGAAVRAGFSNSAAYSIFRVILYVSVMVTGTTVQTHVTAAATIVTATIAGSASGSTEIVPVTFSCRGALTWKS
jgi:hypothetical protein